MMLGLALSVCSGRILGVAPDAVIRALFTGGLAGFFLDPSDSTTVFQDSAGTTPGVLNSPVGKRLDKSGNANHFLQATAGVRPLWKLNGSIYSDLFDGVDDGYTVATVTLVSDMDVFIAIKRSSTAAGLIFSDSGATVVIGAFNSAGGANGAISGTLGTPTIWVNGVQLAGGTAVLQTTLDAALPNGTWEVVEIRNLNPSTLTSMRVGQFGGFQLAADIGPIVALPAQSAANRNTVRTWVGAKVGLTL